MAYVTVSILLGGFYIRIFEIPFAILRYISFLSYPRFTLQGLAINEMKDDVYKPQGCLSASMLGATKAEIDNLVNNDTQAEQGRMGGTKCTLVADGAGTMDYWDFKVSFVLSCFETVLRGREKESERGRAARIPKSSLLPFLDLIKNSELFSLQFSLGGCFGALIAFLTFFHIASYFCLRTLYKARR